MNDDARRLRHVVLGNPSNRRIAFFQRALRDAGLCPARVVSYRDLLDGRLPCTGLFTGTDVLRIDSPGEDFDVEKRLIALGADETDANRGEHIGRTAALALEDDHGRLRFPRQWYLGYRRLLNDIHAAHQTHPETQLYNTPLDIALMFDKPACQRMLANAGIPVPRMLEDVLGFENLVDRANQRNWQRVFVKLAHGSSAAGVVAIDLTPQQMIAVTSVELSGRGPAAKRYNNLRLQTYTDQEDIRQIVDYLCGESAQVEEWLPKASQGGRMFDLRILVVAGTARHTVVRSSTSPMTNLHLGNRRGDVDKLRTSIGPYRWREILATAEQAAGLFPRSLYVAIDVLVTPGFRQEFVLETNAFGDLLPRTESNGRDTYAAEVLACCERSAHSDTAT